METTNNLMSVKEVKLKYIADPTTLKRKKISSSEDAVQTLLEGYDQDTIGMQEQFIVMLLNRNNSVLGLYKVSKGGITGALVDIRLIMVAALKSLATGIILSHNHPSGNTQPSQQDIKLTEQIKDACKLMDIALLDHVIVTTHHDYYSFANEGMLG